MEKSKIPQAKHRTTPTMYSLLASSNQAARNPLRRRSKSTADLMTARINFKPTLPVFSAVVRQPVVNKRKSLKGLVATTTTMPARPRPRTVTNRAPIHSSSKQNPIEVKSTAVKRQMNNADEQPKAKIAKTMKPPPYDYKARFQILLEKHKSVVEQHKITDEANAEKLKQFNLLSSKLEQLSNKQIDQQKKIHTLKSENDQLLLTCSSQRDCIEDIEKQLSIQEQDFMDLSKRNDRLQKQYEIALKKIESLSDVKEKLEKALEHIDILTNNLELAKIDLQRCEKKRRFLHNTVQDLKGNIRVFCRIRPMIENDNNKIPANIKCVDDNSLEIKKTKESINQITGRLDGTKISFAFDKVFGPNASQEDIFLELSDFVQSALDGYDVCVFAYGQTGSGKTYTMQGDFNSANEGMIPRTVDLIFKRIDYLKNNDWTYYVSLSVIEIYNEVIIDLLDENKKQCDIKFNDGKGTTVTNILIREVKSIEEIMTLINIANRNRKMAVTDFNEHSSRSHAVTKISLEGYNRRENMSYKGSLNLVDLAGSESARTSSGTRLIETKNINKSLSTLGKVMLSLYNKENHIPYRESKLTYLLQNCLGGSSKTLMILNISPLEHCYNESLNSLRFASRVKEVKMGLKKNKSNTSISHSTSCDNLHH